MALKFSTGLKQAWLGTATGDDLKALLTAVQINIYKNDKVRPASPDDALSGYTALAEIIKAGPAGGTFGNAVAGVLPKASEVWFDSSCAAGTALWFRLFIYTEDPTTSSTSLYRIDGDCGSTGTEDLVLASATLTASQVLTIDVFNISLP